MRLGLVDRRVPVAPLVAGRHRFVVRVARQDDLAEEIEDRRLHGRIAPARTSDRARDDGAVGWPPAVLVDVGAIDRKAGDDFGDDVAQAVEREVA